MKAQGGARLGNSMQLQPPKATSDPDFKPAPRGAIIFLISVCMVGQQWVHYTRLPSPFYGNLVTGEIPVGWCYNQHQLIRKEKKSLKFFLRDHNYYWFSWGPSSCPCYQGHMGCLRAASLWTAHFTAFPVPPPLPLVISGTLNTTPRMVGLALTHTFSLLVLTENSERKAPWSSAFPSPVRVITVLAQRKGAGHCLNLTSSRTRTRLEPVGDCR